MTRIRKRGDQEKEEKVVGMVRRGRREGGGAKRGEAESAEWRGGSALGVRGSLGDIC